MCAKTDVCRLRATLPGPVKFILMLSAAAMLSGCVLTPEWKRLAADGDLESFWIETDRFQHRVLANRIPGSHLRIYVDGDGSPWIHETRVAVDPTPTNPLLLELMHDVTHPAAYLGRPCYFGSATSRNCASRWWTLERYSRPVVESMCAAANELVSILQPDTVQLIGYSGGGAIVVAMAACTERSISVVTIAGNLDPAAWTSHHGYTALRDLPDFRGHVSAASEVSETHWQCQHDEVVPPAVTDGFFAARPEAKRIVVENCSHATGWAHYWGRIIKLSSSEPVFQGYTLRERLDSR